MNEARGAALLSAARELEPWLVETRRTLHRRPELGREEVETAAFIRQALDGLGVPWRGVGTGTIGLLRGGGPGPVVAVRADIDALPVAEGGDLPFKSQRPGLMHACGHDAHAAIALGVAKLFAEGRARLPGSLVLLFQPDEEGEGGAEGLIAAGCLSDPKVDAVLGLHVMPYLDVGQVEVRKGALNGSSSTLAIAVRGSSSHGAYPERGVDAVVIAGHLVLALNGLVSRALSPLEEAVITIGTIHGGQRSNIVADEVLLEATMRTTSEAARETLVERARALVEGIPASFGGRGELLVRRGYPALVNHDAPVEALVRAAASVLGGNSVNWKEKPSLGVEDFSYYLHEAPGVFWHLGCGSGPTEARAPLHSPDFRLDEACLAYGVAVQAAAVLELMGEAGGS